MRKRSSIILTVCLVLLAVGCSRQARLERAIQKADQFYTAGKYDAAEIEYRNVLRLEPSNATAMKRLGSIYYAEGRFLQAFVVLSKAADLLPDDSRIRIMLGTSQIQFGQFEEARQQALGVLSRQPTNEQALLLLADSTLTTNDLADTFEHLQELQAQAGDRPGYHLALGGLYLRGRDLERAKVEIVKAVELDPESPDAQAALGNLYLRQGNLQDAETHLKRAADLEGWRSFRKLGYAQFKLRTGDTEEGKRLLEEMLEHAPDFFPAWIRLAEQGLTEKEYDQCQKLVDEILRRDPENYDARLLLGRLYLAQADPDRGLLEFERLLRQFPDSPGLHYYVGLAQSRKGDYAAATASLTRAIDLNPAFDDAVLLKAQLNIGKGDLSSAVVALQELIGGHQVSEKALALLAEAYRRLGRPDAALAVCSQWMALSPKNPEAPLLAGRILLAENKGSLARESFNKVLEIKPDHAMAIEELVNLDLAEGDFASAKERADSLLDRMPRSPIPQVLLAKIYVAQKRFPEAEACLKQAITLAPESTTAYLVLAQIQIESEQFSLAVSNLVKLLELEPGNRLGLMRLGTLQERLGHPLEASETYQKLLQVDPENGLALNNLANLFSTRLNDLDQAYAFAQRARKSLPKDPAIMDTLGWILYQKGDYEGASMLLRDAAKGLPGNAEVSFHAGMNYYKLGREAEALAALSQACETNQTFDGRKEAEARLGILRIDPQTAGPKVEQELEDRLKKDARDPVALMRLAAIHDRKGDSIRAAHEYEAVTRLVPSSFSAHFNLARLYAEDLDDPQKALEHAKTARRLAPEDPQVLYALGKIAYKTREYQWALSLLRESSLKMTADPTLFYNLGLAELSVGDIGRATNALQRALDQSAAFPAAEQARQLLALCVLIDNPAKLKESIDRVNQLRSEDPTRLPAIYLVGVFREQQGDLSAARQMYEQVLQPDQLPLFSPARRRLAIVAVKELDPSSIVALQLARKARQDFPADAEVGQLLGKVTYYHDDFESAAQLLRECTRSTSANTETYFYLGMASLRLGQTNECRSALQKALDLGLESSLAQQARATLAATQ